MAKDDYKPEVWTYIGRRVASDGRLAHFWRDGDGAVLGYDKLKGASIGAKYTIAVWRKPESQGGGVNVLTGADFEDSPDADEEELARWVAEDRSAYTRDEKRKLEARLKRQGKEDLGRLTLTEARDMLWKQPPGGSAAFLAVIFQYLGAA